MSKKFVSVLCCLVFSLCLNAQASGGQIRRKTVHKTQKVKKKENNRENTTGVPVTNKQGYPATPPPIIQPLPIEKIPIYNVVVGTMSDINNARALCQSLRDRGCMSYIYWDFEKKLNRIIIGGTDSEQEAISLRNVSRQTFQDAWILYVVNGKEERYF